MDSASATHKIHCCIVGGGPAGMVLGYLLARSGIEVAVLEKHKDFLRDFRGDTIHPSTLEVMHELGLLEKFLERPHQEVEHVGANICGTDLIIADFRHLPTACKFLAFMPQWDFLNFLAEEAKALPTFHLHVETQVTDLIWQGNQVMGVSGQSPTGPVRFLADLTVGADGRHSTVRSRAGLKAEDISAPMDVLWMRISRNDTDPLDTLGRIVPRHFLVLINRRDYWQCAFIIPKGKFEELKSRGLPAFHEELLKAAPFLSDRVTELDDWDKIKLLTVTIDRLLKWHLPGLLCIGDSAHAMSPIGGVGINLAIQDAVATANLLTFWLKRGGPIAEGHLREVQERRTWPTGATQAMQVFLQNHVVQKILASDEPVEVPFILKLLQIFPILRRIPARVIGLGFRPEHVKFREQLTPPRSGSSV